MTFADLRVFRTAVAPVLAVRVRVRGVAARTMGAGLASLAALRSLIAQAGRTLREGLAREEVEPAAALPAPRPPSVDRPVDRPLEEPDLWELRARAAEARLATLEARLAATERDLLELRSRNVCLQGKLAAANATARYQSLALELEGGAPPAAARMG